MLFRRWKQSDATKLRKLENRFNDLLEEYDSLKCDYRILHAQFKAMEKKIEEKEVTHVQKVKVEINQSVDYWDAYP